MTVTHIIVNRNTGKQVGALDTERAEIKPIGDESRGSDYLPTGEVTIFTGAPPSAETALVDERDEPPDNRTELLQQVRDELAGTPLELLEK